MKSSLIMLAVLLSGALPGQAHAAFATGYMMGSSSCSGSQKNTTIPPACFYAEDFEMYYDCRMASGIHAYGITKNYKNYINIEWQVIQHEREKDKQ